jgi:hypothetical protein
MEGKRSVTIEGYTADEILALPEEQLDAFVFVGEPLLFRAGTATILGEFRIVEDRLVAELAQIDGGGEGVLPTLWVLVERFAARRGLTSVEWIVHAVNCARPNPKLRRVLERRGFEVRDIAGIGKAYYLVRGVE